MKHVMSCCALVCACSDPPPSYEPPPSRDVAAFRAAPRHDLDLLFVVDDSPSSAALPAVGEFIAPLYDVLSTLDPPQYDLHAGVVTADLGTTGSLVPDQPGPATGACAGAGDDGRLRGPFLADALRADGTHVTNAPGSPLTMLAAQLAAGHAGCEVQQHARVVHRALNHPGNAGFLRSTAALGVIVIAAQDDCSVRDPAMFASPFDPFRCTTSGIRCDQPLDASGDKTGCVVRDDSADVAPITPFAQFLIDIKGDARSLMLATLTGPTTPVAVETHGTSLALAPACSYRDTMGQLHGATPALRDAALLTAAPGAATASAAPCDADLGPALTQIGHALKTALGDPCIDPTGLHDDDPFTPGVQPYCGAYDVRDSAPDTKVILPRCPATSGDCFDLVADPRVCPSTPGNLRIRITRAADPPPDAWTHVHCSI